MRKGRLLARLAAFVLTPLTLLSSIPVSAADGDAADIPFFSTTSAYVTDVNDDVKKLTVESYLTSTDDTENTIKPCDIIFVMDQSKWMNTEDDKGAQREAIIYEIKELISALADPTEGEHRIAIAGYGRVNLGAVDPYNSAIYPGLRTSGSGISFNTGYYTADGFISQNGWTDLSASQMSGSGLPKMPDSYKSAMTYDKAFMTLEEADSVLNSDTMQAWYSGASRMDAGLTIAEQLSSVANENDPDGDRNLIVCILASSLPIQNTVSSNTSVIRMSAVLQASEVLKEQGATIFAFGDYHASGKVISGSVQDTEDTFNAIMEQACTKPEYFYSFSDFSSVTDALNQMVTQITITAAGEAEYEYSVEAAAFKAADDGEESFVTWQDIVDYYGQSADSLINGTMAKVELYTFEEYDSDDSPIFASEPYSSYEVPLSDIVGADGIVYNTNLIPIPSLEEEKIADDEHHHYGCKIVITVSSPVTVTYKWAEDGTDYAPANAVLPEPEIIVLGTSHTAGSVKTTDNTSDFHYIFAGWYLDADCTEEYEDMTDIYTNITLYGKWERYLLVSYYWNIWETGYEYSDDVARMGYGDYPLLYVPEGVPGYSFGGWYSDKDVTSFYDPAPMTEDISLYAKWVPKNDTSYSVHFYQQNISDDGYTEVSDDAVYLSGVTDTYPEQIIKEYTGFAYAFTTYEDSAHAASQNALTISGDGTLKINMYFNRNTYSVTYDGNGAEEGVPCDSTAYRYGASVSVAEGMVRDSYDFAGWNTMADGSGTDYAPGDAFAIYEDTTLYAKWTHSPWEIHIIKKSDSDSLLKGARFALYTKNSDESRIADDISGVQYKLTVNGTEWYLMDVCLTDENGSISWSALTGDEYYVLELEAPDGYSKGRDTGQIVTALYGGVREITVVNNKKLTVPSGVPDNDFPVFLTIACASVGAAVIFAAAIMIKRKKHRKYGS